MIKSASECPHLILFIPGIIRFPDPKTDCEVTARSRDKGPFTGVRNVHSGHKIDYLTEPLVYQNAVSHLHVGPFLIVFLHFSNLASPRPLCNLSAFAEDHGRKSMDECARGTLRSSESEGGCFGGLRRRNEGNHRPKPVEAHQRCRLDKSTASVKSGLIFRFSSWTPFSFPLLVVSHDGRGNKK